MPCWQRIERGLGWMWISQRGPSIRLDMPAILIRDVNIEGRAVDIRVREGLIVEIGGGLEPQGEVLLSGSGAIAIPGLHDHHIHLRSAVAARHSVSCGPPSIQNAADLITALNCAPGSGWIRGIGYHESVAGEIDRHWLDREGPDRPIRIQHRSGRLWHLNSQACDQISGAPGDGRWLDSDAALSGALPRGAHDCAPLVRQLLDWGITGVTDATPRNDDAEAARLARDVAPLRLIAMGNEERTCAPLKIHEHEYNLPSLESLARRIRGAHEAGRTVAIHCVTLAELMLALAAWDEVGAHQGDRIEHGAIIPEHAITRICDHSLAIVTQPLFPVARAAIYARDVDPRDRPDLWRLRSLIEAGVTVAAGSDAPFESANPWEGIRAATLCEKEGITEHVALALYLRDSHDLVRTRRLKAGAPADFVLLDAERTIKATFLAGERVSGMPLPTPRTA